MSNTASEGGAVHVVASNLEIDDSKFTLNVATGAGGGGALYIASGSSVAMRVHDALHTVLFQNAKGPGTLHLTRLCLV